MKSFQIIFAVALAAWTGVLLLAPLDWAMNSFVHLINLVFHEAGHIIFSPFGEFMTILGGSLMQVLIPLICAAAFLVQQVIRSAHRSASGGPAKASWISRRTSTMPAI